MFIYDAIMAFSDWMWGLPMLVILIGGGIWLSFACDFVQVKHFWTCMRHTFGSMFSKDNSELGGISGFQGVTACLANTIGTGNIVGVGVAIALGGPGAVFWMWVVGFIAMALKYSEIVLSLHTREKGADGRWKGSAAHYLKLVWRPMGFLWAICIVFVFAISCGIHTGSVGTAAKLLGVPAIVSTIIVLIITAFVIMGGMKNLVTITDKLVPFMTIIYLIAGLIVIVMNIENLLPALKSIFASALSGTAATGGFSGAALSAAIRNGCARGVYSSDAGNVRPVLHMLNLT